MSMFNLKADGEMVYIIPRSWTSGAYFKQFRKRFFEEGALEHIHLFVSRDKVFEKESVLQETIIIKAKRHRTSQIRLLLRLHRVMLTSLIELFLMLLILQ